AVGQAGVGHHGRHAGAVDAVLFEASPGCFEDALSRGLLLVLAVAHGEPPWLVRRRSCPSWRAGSDLGSTKAGARSHPAIVLRPYYDIMIVIPRSERRS